MYVTQKWKIVSSYDVVFGEIFYGEFLYMSQPYAEAMAMRTDMLYIPYATSSKGDMVI